MSSHGISLDESARMGGPWRWFEDALYKTTGFVAAALLTAVIALLFAGVMARYVFHTPLIWSDELSSILFLWLSMTGAALATYRVAHMRMTAVATHMGAQWQGFFTALSIGAMLLFFCLILYPAFLFAEEEMHVTTSALQISNVWRAAALPIGFALMAIFSFGRLLDLRRDPKTYVAVGLLLLVSALLWLVGPYLKPLGNYNLLVFFVLIVGVCVFASVPIAMAFALATFGYLALTTRMPVMVLVGRIDEGMSHLMLLAIPAFVFLGVLLEMTGMARAMVQFLASLLGHVRGGLSYVLVGAMYLVSGISGSKAADMAAIAPALFPEMVKRGSKKGDLVALLSATGAQTETIPPSIVLITVGSVASVSISALFIGGLLPAFVLGLGLCAVIAYRYRNEDLSAVVRAPMRTVGKYFIIALPALALPFVIRAAVVEGVATATEVSTIGIVYAIFAGLFIYRQFEWRKVYPLLIDTAALSGAILIIIGAASGMAWALTQSGFSRDLAQFMQSLPGGSTTFLIVSIIAFIILGSLLEGIPAIVLFGPLMFPIARAMEIHDVHYAMVVILSMGLGLFAPPFGVGYYTACAIARVDPDEGMRPIWGYMLALLIGLIIVAAVPWISIGFL